MAGLNLNKGPSVLGKAPGNPGKAVEGASAGPRAQQADDIDSSGEKVKVTTIEDSTPKLKTAEEVGLSDSQIKKDQESNEVEHIMAHEQAGAAGVSEETEGKTFSSHPVANFKIGRFHFEKSTLVLRGKDDVDEFEKLLQGIPAPNRVLIKEIDTKLAGQIAAAHATQRATKSFDSSVGRQALENLQRDSRTVGTDALDASTSGGESFAEQGGHNENLPLTPEAIAAAAAVNRGEGNGTGNGDGEGEAKNGSNSN